jgi:E3 ubiquitin-protein ligase RGLG
VQTVIGIVGRTLEPFDDDNIIPAFGFGDSRTGDKTVFPLHASGEGCRGFDDVLRRYSEVTPRLTLAGPTNFAPIIYEAIRQVRTTRSYHILVIIADGQVTNEKETAAAIVEASKYALCTSSSTLWVVSGEKERRLTWLYCLTYSDCGCRRG